MTFRKIIIRCELISPYENPMSIIFSNVFFLTNGTELLFLVL